MDLATFLRRITFTLMYWGREAPPWDTGISPPELIAYINNHTPGRAIDMGCGTGTNAVTLASRGWKVTAIDFVARAVRTAERKARLAGVEVDFRVGDVSRIDSSEGPFELVLDIGCFHGLPAASRSRYLKNLETLLVPGGTFLLYVFFREDQEASGPGVVEAELEEIGRHLKLASRQDGSERGRRPAAWLEFEKERGGQ